MTTVMVTGVGAIIGYGILRSLRKADESIRLVGTDIYSDAVGQEWANDFRVAPYTSDKNYLTWLERTIRECEVDLLIPGIEQDLHFYSLHHERIKSFGVTVVLNRPELVEVTKDKWLTHQTLKDWNSPVRINSLLDGNFDGLSQKLGLPFLLKPRRGYASKGLVRVHNREEFKAHHKDLGEVLMAQPIVGNDDEEYTTGVFGDGSGKVCASITFRRVLAIDGSTAKATVFRNAALDAVIASLCSNARPIGPTNFQFRNTDEGWKLLEINPRISSSTSLRTAFGYNESKMSLDFFLHGKKIEQPPIRSGSGSRFIEDRIVYDSDHI